MRKAVTNISIMFFFISMSVVPVQAQAPVFVSSPHVYKVTARQCISGPHTRSLTGFRVRGVSGIVTALHGVLGCRDVTAKTDDGKEQLKGLRIALADIARDSAMLWSEGLGESRDYGLVAVNNPKSTDYDGVYAIGYPKDVSRQRPTRKIEVLDKTQLINLVSSDLLLEFIERDSPALSIEVLSVQTHLAPGHSGAPLFNNKGHVIAVANGGLDYGRLEMSWAIPWDEIKFSSISDEDVDRLAELAAKGLSLSVFSESEEGGIETPAPPTPEPTPIEPEPGDVQEYAGINFVYVPHGEFRMGSSDQEVQRAIDLCRSYPNDGGGECSTKFEDERPTRNVYTNAYWIMRTEVTNAQFAEFVNAGGYLDSQYWSSEGWSWRSQEGITEPGYWRNDAVNQANYPVVGISWFEAEAYVNWLQQQTGIPVRLPTEEEWEKAARGTDGRLFPWGDSWSYGRANFCDSRCTLYEWADQNTDDGYAFTAPVGSYPGGASPYGALDMSGNVWEWVSNRARKGGSWTNDPEVLRTPERLQDERYTRPKNVEFPSKAGTGFRLAITYTPGQ